MPDPKQAGLPRAIPRLTASMICHRAFHGPNNTRSLSGWACEITDTPEQHQALLDLLAEAADSYPEQFAQTHAEQESADLWNGVMESAGYVLQNDQYVLPTEVRT